jgi:hypothetical protein
MKREVEELIKVTEPLVVVISRWLSWFLAQL